MITPDQPVTVYRNLTRRCWSLRQGGKVVGHADEVTLTNVTMTVQPAGRDRVRRTRHKVVHAWLTGQLSASQDEHHCPERLYYNPYQDEAFHTGNGVPVQRAAAAHFDTQGRAFIRSSAA